MTQSNFKFATFGRYLGRCVVLGTMVSETVRWARWSCSESWFKVSNEEVSEF